MADFCFLAFDLQEVFVYFPDESCQSILSKFVLCFKIFQNCALCAMVSITVHWHVLCEWICETAQSAIMCSAFNE